MSHSRTISPRGCRSARPNLIHLSCMHLMCHVVLATRQPTSTNSHNAFYLRGCFAITKWLLDSLCRCDFLGSSLSAAEELLLVRLFCHAEDDDDFFSSSFLSLSFLLPSFSVLDFLQPQLGNLPVFYYCDDLLSHSAISLSLSQSQHSLSASSAFVVCNVHCWLLMISRPHR